MDRSLFECVYSYAEPFEYFPILISLIFDRHRRRRCRQRSLHSRRIKAIHTASRSDIKANGILLNRSKPTECSLRMHVNLGWIPSCIYFALSKCIPFLVCCCIFRLLEPFLLPFSNKKKKNLYCSGFFSIRFRIQTIQSCVCVFISSHLQKPSIHHVAVYMFVFENVFVFADPKNS